MKLRLQFYSNLLLFIFIFQIKENSRRLIIAIRYNFKEWASILNSGHSNAPNGLFA
jgi:hypothetical protein